MRYTWAFPAPVPAKSATVMGSAASAGMGPILGDPTIVPTPVDGFTWMS